MQRITTLLGALVLAAGLLLAPSRGAAQVSPTGFGIGADVGLSSSQMLDDYNLGVGGISATYWLNESLALNFILNLGFTAPDGDDVAIQTGFGGGVFGVLARGDNTILALGGRLNLGALIWSRDRSRAVIGLDVPLRVEHWFDGHFALNGQVGVSVGIAPRTGELDSADVPFSMNIGTSAWGSAGFTYYFDSCTSGAPAPAHHGGGGGGGGRQDAPPPDPESGSAGW